MAHKTGIYFAVPSEYELLASLGMEFVVTLVAPSDLAGAAERFDAAEAAGIQLVTGMYAFGGPQAYTLSAGNWTLSAAAETMLNYMESRKELVFSFFGFNEPYYIHFDTGVEDPNGAQSADELRAFRATLQGYWPDIKIWHDLGYPSEWAPGGSVWTPGVGNKFADQTNMTDFPGVFEYPFQATYQRAQAIARVNKEINFCLSSMRPARPSLLAQSFVELGHPWPNTTDFLDWNCTMRTILPTEAVIGWYTWEIGGLYDSDLHEHPEDWGKLLATACQGGSLLTPAHRGRTTSW